MTSRVKILNFVFGNSNEEKFDLNQNFDKPDNNMHSISQGIKELVTMNSIL